jgi:type III pantothenate kinase
MNILVDIGNSRVKWAVIQAGRIGESQHFARTKSGIKASLNAEWKTLEDVEAIFVSNVAGEKIATQLTEWTQKQWGITPSFIQSEAKKFGVTNAY